MKNQPQITIKAEDNGYTIKGIELDPQKRKVSIVALTDDALKTELHKLVDSIVIAEPAKR